MVTGRVPFVAETPLAVILKHVSDPLPLPSTLKADIPEAIEQVVLKALAKDPEDRFTTVAEFLSAWKRAWMGPDYRGLRLKIIVERAPFGEIVGQSQGTLSRNPGCFYSEGCIQIWRLEPLGSGLPDRRMYPCCRCGGAFFIFNRAASSTHRLPTTPPNTHPNSDPADKHPTASDRTVIPPTGETLFEDDFSDESIWAPRRKHCHNWI